MKLMLRGRRSHITLFGESPDAQLHLNHASFGDFLHDKDRSKVYYVDREEWMYTAFCDTVSLGCNLLDFICGCWRRVGYTARSVHHCHLFFMVVEGSDILSTSRMQYAVQEPRTPVWSNP